MTKKLIAPLLIAILFAGTCFAQMSGKVKEVKSVTIHIDGFMKSKSGAI